MSLKSIIFQSTILYFTKKIRVSIRYSKSIIQQSTFSKYGLEVTYLYHKLFKPIEVPGNNKYFYHSLIKSKKFSELTHDIPGANSYRSYLVENNLTKRIMIF